jgi:PBP1b-binding outer membrane lipoprotein LpoB
MRALRQIATLAAASALLLTGCSSEGDPSSTRGDSSSARQSPSPAEPEQTRPSRTRSDQDQPPVQAVSVLGLAEQRHRGDRL